MRRLLTGVAVLAAGLLPAPAASANHCPANETQFGGVSTVNFSCHGGGEGGGGGGSGVRYDPKDLVTAISQVNGQPCTILASNTSPQGESAIVLENALQTLPVFGQPLHAVYQWIVNGLPGCPGASPSPEAVAWSFVRTAAPPESTPYIAPGYVITGKKAYLETRGPTADTQTYDTVLGPLTVRFQAQTITIDWGDGSGIDAGPFSVPTKPYPDGDAAHVYTDAGAFDVAVRTAWSAEWSVAGEGGILTGLTRTERIENLDARQMQAVRDS